MFGIGALVLTYYWVLLPSILVYAIRFHVLHKLFTHPKRKAAAGDDVGCTPSTADAVHQVHSAVHKKCAIVREYDIVSEAHDIALSSSIPPSSFTKPGMSSLRLPLNECSRSAADAIAASDRSTFPSSFDLVASGGGLVAFYGGAVTAVLGDLARRGIVHVGELHGVSSGALICACFLGVESGFTRMEDVYRCYQLFGRSKWLSPAMRQFLDECLPPDIHVRASGRMHITVTEIGPQHCFVPKRRVVSQFSSREAFLDAVMASTILPGLTSPWLHRPPSRPSALWMDGGVVMMPTAMPPPRPYLKLAQLATVLRLGYWPMWILQSSDADFDLHLALPALKDVVRLFRGERLPFGAMAFSESGRFPV